MQPFDISQNWWQLIIVAVSCYLIGCFNFALLISKLKKRDITKIGSGNPGTMNMSREFGWKVGVLTFFCDALKGGVPAIILYFIYRDYAFANTQFAVADFMKCFGGIFIIIGHIFPVFLHFKGGKGIASTLGLMWACLSLESWIWIPVGFGFLLFLVLFIFLTEWGSLGSLVGTTSFSIIQMLIFIVTYRQYPVNAYLVAVFMIIVGINLLTWLAHAKNLQRLFSGEERHTSIRKMVKKK